MFDLSGKSALVTGASGGIGGAIAHHLHGAGAAVGLSGTRVDALEALAAELGLPCRVQSQDDTPGQGPLGGVATALRRARAGRVLFLGCDMPFLTAELTQRILAVEAEAVFASVKGTVGFPFVLSPAVLPKVEAQLASGQRSLQRLAVRLRARRIRVLVAEVPQLQNLNTPADLAEALKTAACLGRRF